MRVSIIIPTLNEEERIEDALVSALTANPHEVIVADGGSTDRTIEIVKKNDCQLVECSRGRANQQNSGAQSASGDVFLFLHADCELNGHACHQITESMTNDGVIAGAFRQSIPTNGVLYRWLEWGNAARVRWRRLPYGDQGIFVRREIFKELGGFPNEPLMEDLLLMRRLRRRGKIVLLDGPLKISPRRWQKHGVIRQTLRNWSLLTGERLGIPIERLAQFYLPHWKPTRERR